MKLCSMLCDILGVWGEMDIFMGFSGGSPVKEYACNAGNIGDVGSIPGSGRSPR